jgi:putative Holliday junction resolvase
MTETGRILAVDFGKRRVGLAISDPTGSIAFPLKTIDRKKDTDPLEEQIASIVSENEVQRVVIGLPLTENGKRGRRAVEVESFVSRLRSTIDCQVHTWDERYSTIRAVRVMHEIGEKTGNDKGKVDRISAVIILQNYLEAIQKGSC